MTVWKENGAVHRKIPDEQKTRIYTPIDPKNLDKVYSELMSLERISGFMSLTPDQERMRDDIVDRLIPLVTYATKS